MSDRYFVDTNVLMYAHDSAAGEKLSFAKTPRQLNFIDVTCYNVSLYVVDFKCAPNFEGSVSKHINTSLKKADSSTLVQSSVIDFDPPGRSSPGADRGATWQGSLGRFGPSWTLKVR